MWRGNYCRRNSSLNTYRKIYSYIVVRNTEESAIKKECPSGTGSSNQNRGPDVFPGVHYSNENSVMGRHKTE